MTGISSLGSNAWSLRQSSFTRIDTDGDGKVSQEEFVAGRPKHMSESRASDLFAKIDTEDTGSLTEDQLDGALKANRRCGASGCHGGGLSEETLATVLQLLQETLSALSSDSAAPPDGGRPPADEIFSKIDADGDGVVTKDEFVAARPDDVSEEQAAAFFDRLDSEDSGSITLEQFEAGGPGRHHGSHGAGGPPPPPPTETAQSGPSLAEALAALDTDQNGEISLEELASSLSETPDEDNSAQSTALAQLLSAIQAYASYQTIDSEQTSTLLAAT